MARRKVGVAAGVGLAVAALLGWAIQQGVTQNSPAAGPQRAECPATRPYVGPPRALSDYTVKLYFNGELYVPSPDGATGAGLGAGDRVATVTCRVTVDPPEGQELVTPWPDGAAWGLAEGTAVHRAAGRVDDCILITTSPAATDPIVLEPAGQSVSC